jgi:hypothetical protein
MAYYHQYWALQIRLSVPSGYYHPYYHQHYQHRHYLASYLYPYHPYH